MRSIPATGWLLRIVPLLSLLLVAACETPGPTTPPPLRLDSYSTKLASCQELGAVMAEETCRCFTKMTYDRLNKDVRHSLADNAKSLYSGADVVAVVDTRVYMNRAVAHGIAFRCNTAGS